MADGFNRDTGPDPRAVAYLESKGYVRSWRWSSTWHEQHAFAFTLAGVWRLDVLGAAHELVTKAQVEGQTFEAFRSVFEERMNALGFAGPQVVTEFEEGPRKVDLTAAWRVRVIYDTNMRAAYAAAEWQAIEDTKADFPALEYQGVEDEVTRASHLAFFGVVRLVGDAFWLTHYPPNDWFCRCWVVQISAAELASGAIKLTSDVDLAARGYDPDPQTWPLWTDKKTGMIARVPPGIGPGFAYNPGMARREVLGELLARRTAGLDPDMLRAASADLVNFPQFMALVADAVDLGKARAASRNAAAAQAIARGLERRQADAAGQAAADAAGKFPPASWPLGATPAELADEGRAIVVANASAIGHSADMHPTTPADWSRVHQLLEHGEIWRSPAGDVSLFGQFLDGEGRPQLWTLALKAVEGAWRVRTLFATSPRRRAKITRERQLVRGASGRLSIEGVE